jgi:folate-dependent phosphoribosylglycinamide formyltransferase PurN
MATMRVALLCARSLNEFNLKVIEPIFQSTKHTVCACLIDDSPKKTLFQRLKRHLKLGRGAYTLIMAFNSFLKKGQRHQDTITFIKSKKVPLIFYRQTNIGEVVEQVRGRNPDVICLISGFGIIKEPFLSLCEHGVISYHHGNMRKYRGQPPTFWELYYNEKEVGITLQKLSEGLDCGEVILEKSIRISPVDTYRCLKKRVFLESVDMMHNAIDLLEQKGFNPKKVNSLGEIYTIPNFRQWVTLHLKVFFRIIKYKFELKSKSGTTR